MKIIRVTALTAFLATGVAVAQAEEIRLDDAQLDAVAGGFLNFGEFRALLTKGLSNPGELDAGFGRALLRALFSRASMPMDPPYTNGGHVGVPD
jgi:hypothetical protein